MKQKGPKLFTEEWNWRKPISSNNKMYKYFWTNCYIKYIAPRQKNIKLVFCLFNYLIVHLRCTLRSGLHETTKMIRIFPNGFEINHACKWTSDNFPGMLTYLLFLENCHKTICMHGYSSIHVDKSLRKTILYGNIANYNMVV